MGKKKRAKEWKKTGWTPEQVAALQALGGNPAWKAGRGAWPTFLGKRPSEQFLVGALIGAATAYVLGDEALRAKLIKGGLKLYSGIVGGIEEMKEQMADVRAEMEAEQRGTE